jgi:hypothetical protein
MRVRELKAKQTNQWHDRKLDTGLYSNSYMQ